MKLKWFDFDDLSSDEMHISLMHISAGTLVYLKETPMCKRMTKIRELVVQGWTTEKNCSKEMDVDLAEAISLNIDLHFAELINGPWLGMATTRQLLEELKVRCTINRTIDYKTVDDK